jgi:hypothetical protein
MTILLDFWPMAKDLGKKLNDEISTGSFVHA